MDTSITGEPAAPEHVGVAFRAITAGLFVGTGVTATALYVARGLQASQPVPAVPVTTGLVPDLILTGWLGGAGLAALCAWALMAPISSSYRRGAFAMVAAFATLVLALVTMPADALFGKAGLLAISVVGLAGGLLLSRRAWKRLA